MADYSAANDLRREGEAADAKERMIARLKKLIPFLGIILMILIQAF